MRKELGPADKDSACLVPAAKSSDTMTNVGPYASVGACTMSFGQNSNSFTVSRGIGKAAKKLRVFRAQLELAERLSKSPI